MKLSQAGSVATFVRYNAGLVFAGKFVYFMLLAPAVFLFVTVAYTLDAAAPPNAATVYYFLLVPGLLLAFYPSAYGIQSDAEAGMLETLFGIPDHRFKVWLVRQLVLLAVVALMLLLLALLCRLGLAPIPLGAMLFHLMAPVAFVSCVGFGLAAWLRSGNGAAVGLVLLLAAFWVASEPLAGSAWSLFYNPFAQGDELEELLRADTTVRNRAYLAVGALVSLLLGLLRLRDRERFVQ